MPMIWAKDMMLVIWFASLAAAAATAACNATLVKNWSAGSKILAEIPNSDEDQCCAACQSNSSCIVFVIHGLNCFLKGDSLESHAKSNNVAGFIRAPKPTKPTPAPAPSPPLPPPTGSPEWELVETSALPVIGQKHPDVIKHKILTGFETGQYQRINGTFYYTANELGMCPGVVWDLVTRAALWSAPNSSGPWTRVATLRNGSHMQTLCKNPNGSHIRPCSKPCRESCCSGTEDYTSFVTWAPTLIHAPSSVNASGKNVWNLFYSSNQNSHMQDNAFNGITWAVSTTDSMLGPYIDVVGKSGTALPPGGEGVVNIAVNSSHSFSAWKLRNGSWAGFKNNVPGATSFSAGLMVPAGDPQTPGGAWKPAGPNLASGSNCSDGLCFGPENPVVTTMSSDGKFYLAVYDALEQPPANEQGQDEQGQDEQGQGEQGQDEQGQDEQGQGEQGQGEQGQGEQGQGEQGQGQGQSKSAPVCGGGKCNRIGVAFSADGVTWKYSAMVSVQTEAHQPCGQIRTPLGLTPEPERCQGCYSVLFTGITSEPGPSGSFRPVCRAIIRNVNE